MGGRDCIGQGPNTGINHGLTYLACPHGHRRKAQARKHKAVVALPDLPQTPAHFDRCKRTSSGDQGATTAPAQQVFRCHFRQGSGVGEGQHDGALTAPAKRFNHSLIKGTGAGGGADQHCRSQALHHGLEADLPLGIKGPVGQLLRSLAVWLDRPVDPLQAGVNQALPIDHPETVGGLLGIQTPGLQQPHQPLGDAAARAAGPKDDNALVLQNLPQTPQAGQNGGGSHTAGALNVVIEAGQPLPVGLQNPTGIAGTKVLPMHQGTRTHLPHSLDEGLHEGVVGGALQPWLA